MINQAASGEKYITETYKQGYQKPKLFFYGTVSVLTAAMAMGTRCDNGAVKFPSCGGGGGDRKTF